MSDMLFYDKIVPLDTDKHKNTKIALISDYSFTARTNSVPVAGIEFIASSKEFPITFIQNTEGKFIPVIILGMEDDTNLFVTDDGRWNAYYLPAYIRRYPFVPSVGDDKDKLNICVDESYSGFGSESGVPLFNEDGSPSPLMEEVIKLVQDYHGSLQRTSEFCDRLAEADLLTEFNAEFGSRDRKRKFKLSGLYAVDEEKLLNLSEDKALDFFKRGEFSWIYSHLHSLTNFPKMVDIFFS